MSANFLKPGKKRKKKETPLWAAALLWSAAFLSIFLLGIVIVQRTPYIRDISGLANSSDSIGARLVEEVESSTILPSELAPLDNHDDPAVSRISVLDTNHADTLRTEPEKYTIEAGDSIFGIASKYDLEPETILWSNYDVLYDDAHNISVGDELIIPPDDGIYYKWKENDQLQRLADKYRVELKDILECPANNLDVTNPIIEAGNFILFPGGYRETTAFNPIVEEYSPNAGVKRKISGPGGCSWDYAGYGNGSFVWPTASHTLTGNDYWSGHLGLDLGTVMGGPIYATDGGTVIYAGSISGGYGIMVMVDHGNGYQSLYGHLSSVAVRCGQGVSQGQVIGYGGSTGNSTGPHLHFEIRYGGGYVNPWQVL